MNILRFAASLTAVLIAVELLPAQSRDLREVYGTNNLTAAKLIHEANQLFEAGKHKESLLRADAALKLDPKAAHAYFVKALAAGSGGDLDTAVEAYKACVSDKVDRVPRVAAVAATNLALTHAKLGEFETASEWFTRAILEDEENTFGERAKAYRNLALSLRDRGKHLAAFLALCSAYEYKARNIDQRMVREFLDAMTDDEVAPILRFPGEVPKLTPRATATQLTPVPVTGGAAEPVRELFADPAGRYVIAIPTSGDHYHVVSVGERMSAEKVALGRKPLAFAYAGGHLYVMSAQPGEIAKLEPTTGKVVEAYKLRSTAGRSFAVLPTKGRAYYPVDEQLVELNLKTGVEKKQSVPGQVVAADPTERFVFSYVKPTDNTVTYIIDGRPIHIRTGDEWSQTTLFKSVVTPSGLLVAEARAKSASNGMRLYVSPDGAWAGVVGGGGWRPSERGVGGYGVAVFSTLRLEEMLAFVPTGAYPVSVAVNPVTGLIAANNETDIIVSDPRNSGSVVKLSGGFAGPCVWSGDGRFLLAAGKDGLKAYALTLTEQEKQRASTWFKGLVPSPLAKSAATFTPAPGLNKFSTSATREQISKAVTDAIAAGRTDRPSRWSDYPAYTADAAANKLVQEVGPLLRSKEDAGIAVYKLKKAVGEKADVVPLHQALATAHLTLGQLEEAEAQYLTVVRADAGRTNLTVEALTSLAFLLDQRGNGLDSLKCVIQALALDKADPRTISQAVELLRKHKFESEAARVSSLTATTSEEAARLPALPAPGAPKKLAAGDVYTLAARAVVMVATDQGSGSGVCVSGQDVILTNSHVVGGASEVEVVAFRLDGNATKAQRPVKGKVIYRAAAADLAVVKLDKPMEGLKPLAVASASPANADKVYAIGCPGFGTGVLELTVSDGLVSSSNRVIDGAKYIQHSAPINPGNSGGPILDESGRVVGLVTLKAKLDGVGFAVPPEEIRAIFSGN